MATGGNFNDVLRLITSGGNTTVEAKGPLEANADLKEICVWVVQEQANGSDIAYTEMTTTMKNRNTNFQQDPLGQPNRTWTLIVGPITSTSGNLVADKAMAMAIGLMADTSVASSPLKTLLWAQSVRLVN